MENTITYIPTATRCRFFMQATKLKVQLLYKPSYYNKTRQNNGNNDKWSHSMDVMLIKTKNGNQIQIPLENVG